MSSPAPLDVFRCPLSGPTLIEASAGTGKTWNICALYLRLLLERSLPVQNILVVTFTNAATAELRDRIRARIVQTLAALRASGDGGTRGGDPFVPDLLAAARANGSTDQQIERQLELARATFDEAAIFTIHGFCQRALADAPFAARLPLALELLANDADLRREAVNDFWRKHLAAEELGEDLVACLLAGSDTPETLDRLLARRLAKPLSILCWPDGIEHTAAPDLARLRTAHAAARDEWRRRKDDIIAVLHGGLGQLHAGTYKALSVQAAAAEWEALLTLEDPVPHLRGKSKKLDLLGIAKLLDCTKKNCVTPQDPFFGIAQSLLDARAGAQATVETSRLALLKHFLETAGDSVRRRKLERRVVAFDDMLFNLYQRLTDGESAWLSDTLRKRFPAALIDEFQDTDPLQFAIFERIYFGRDAPLFFVGDPKQAIYSFRNADLHAYLGARQHAQAEYTLLHNRRSSTELIEALNALFTVNPRAFLLAGLDYHPVAAGDKPRSLLADDDATARNQDGITSEAPLRVWTLPIANGVGLRKDDAIEKASNACAAEIARLLRGGADGRVTLDGAPLQAGQIAVLVRTHRQGNRMRDALRALGIGSVEVSQASVFHTSDAEDLERVLTAVLEPARERVLRAALATEILGRDAAALAALSEDSPASVALMTRFAGYREQWLRQGISSMLRQLMRDEGVSARLLARPDGERRMTNLLHLAERLQQAAADHRSPQALLQWLSSMRRDERGEEAAQLRLDSDQNLVQIVTVHKAKGLEYPLVLCPFLWDMKAPPNRDEGLEYHDAANRPLIDFRPASKQDPALALQVSIERCAEELRLIYVALTRAVHRCYLVAGCHGERGVTASARGMLNWLVAGSGQSPERWFADKLGAGDIASAWSRLAAASPTRIVVTELPLESGTPIDRPQAAAEDIAALDAPHSIPFGWRIGSFSAMLHATLERPAPERRVVNGPAADHDADLRPDGALEAVGSDDILGFPRGMDAGSCLHAILERADFLDRQSWLPAVRAGLALYPQRLAGANAPGRLERMALSMIEDVTRTRLPTGFALEEVARARRLEELEFHLPSRGLRAARLVQAVRRAGYPVSALGFGTLDGYLNGFVDLVFEHADRFYLLDWKSNHLGDTAASYGQEALAAVMAQHDYHLQYLLYCVALDRYLAQRLPAYDRAVQFGGVLYLFVRGMRPGWQTAGQPAGVYFHRPDDDVVDALSALLGHEREAGT